MYRRSWAKPASTESDLPTKCDVRWPSASWGIDMATILLVEDNAANMKLATFLLESDGHTVLAAVNAEVGLTLARENNPSLILMDIQLPGMDGLQATAL